MSLTLQTPQTITCNDLVFDLWVPHQTIEQRIKQLAAHIARHYSGQRLRVMAILNSAKPFHELLVAELRACHNGPLVIETDALRVKSYNGTQSSGLRWLRHPRLPARSDTHLLLVDDIADSARTLTNVIHHIQSEPWASVATATLLNRPEARDPAVQFTPDFVGFEITNPAVWAVGFGMDLDEQFRDLPDLYGKRLPGQSLPAYTMPALRSQAIDG